MPKTSGLVWALDFTLHLVVSRVARPKCLTLNGVAYPLRFCFRQRVGHSSLRLASAETVQPVPAAVQPSISTIHCKTLINFIKACYSLAVFVESNPCPFTLFTLTFEGSPDRPVPTLSGRSRPARDRRFRPGRKGLVSLQFASPVFLLTDHCPLITAHSCSKSFSCNTYASPRKCCKQKTYGTAKLFRCNIYKKHGEGLLTSLPRYFLTS